MTEQWTATLNGELEYGEAQTDLDGTTLVRFTARGPFNCRTLPSWTVHYGEERITREFGDVWGIAVDTLQEYQPEIRFCFECESDSTWTCEARLEEVIWGGNEAMICNDGVSRHYLHLVMRLAGGEEAPRKFQRCGITLSSQALPFEKYVYAYCDRFSKGDKPCSFREYLGTAWKWGSNKAVGREGEVCRVFSRTKGSPQQYCNYVG